MERKQQRLDALLSKLQWQPLQVYVKHYQSAEMDLSAVAVAYYLMLTAFPLIVIAANIFPYLNLDISVLLSFMEKNLPTNIYPTVSAITTDIFSNPSGGILGVATLTAFWTMSKSLTSLQKAINKAYGVSQHRDFCGGAFDWHFSWSAHFVPLDLCADFFIFFKSYFATHQPSSSFR